MSQFSGIINSFIIEKESQNTWLSLLYLNQDHLRRINGSIYGAEFNKIRAASGNISLFGRDPAINSRATSSNRIYNYKITKDWQNRILVNKKCLAPKFLHCFPKSPSDMVSMPLKVLLGPARLYFTILLSGEFLNFLNKFVMNAKDWTMSYASNFLTKGTHVTSIKSHGNTKM